jgi:hypothetical protein
VRAPLKKPPSRRHARHVKRCAKLAFPPCLWSCPTSSSPSASVWPGQPPYSPPITTSMFGTEPKRLAVRHDGNGHSSFLPSHRPSLGAHINKDRLTTRAPHAHGWTSTWVVRVPGMQHRAFRLVLPIPPPLAAVIRRHLSRPRAALLAIFVGLLILSNVGVVLRRIAATRNEGFGWKQVIPTTVGKSDSCVFGLSELRNLYEWEVESGNYPTRRRSMFFLATFLQWDRPDRVPSQYPHTSVSRETS